MAIGPLCTACGLNSDIFCQCSKRLFPFHIQKYRRKCFKNCSKSTNNRKHWNAVILYLKNYDHQKISLSILMENNWENILLNAQEEIYSSAGC